MRRPLAGLIAAASLAAGCSARDSGRGSVQSAVSPPARTGLERLVADEFRELAGKRVGVVTNHTGVDARLRHIADLFAGAEGVELVALFGPEHGVRGLAQAGDRVGDGADEGTGVPVHSLYGARRKPTAAQLEGLDVLVYDIQDIGVRTYTYLSTLLLCLEAAAEARLPVWVLDRPDPLGGVALDGPVLEPGMESFVGPHTLPLRYGLTVGEYARLVREERGLDVALRVVELEGWRRGELASADDGAWVAPSPNIPTPLAALVFAGFVLIEGTNLSEGRGTTRPFQLFGAPWLQPERVVSRLEEAALPGVRFRVAGFVPTFSKYDGERCRGVELHVVDRAAFRPTLTAVAAIVAVRAEHPEDFAFSPSLFDRLAGTKALREAIERGDEAAAIAASWEPALEAYRARRERVLLYR